MKSLIKFLVALLITGLIIWLIVLVATNPVAMSWCFAIFFGAAGALIGGWLLNLFLSIFAGMFADEKVSTINGRFCNLGNHCCHNLSCDFDSTPYVTYL